MKIIKYTCSGSISNSIASNGDSNGARHSNWEKRCIEKIKAIGVPLKPLEKVYKIKLDFFFRSYRLNQTGEMTLKDCMSILIKAGVLKDTKFNSVRNVSFENRFNTEKPGFTVWLYVDEKNPKNKGAGFNQLPVISTIDMRLDGRTRRKAT